MWDLGDKFDLDNFAEAVTMAYGPFKKLFA